MEVRKPIDLSIGSLLRMQARRVLLQKIYPREQIEAVKQNPPEGEKVRRQARVIVQGSTKRAQNARFAAADFLLGHVQGYRNASFASLTPEELPDEPLVDRGQ
jgi:hypothetical protein